MTSLGDTAATVELTTSNSVFPVGIMLPWGGPTSTGPAGWLFCNGQPISRTTYAALFAMLGTTFGAGDSSTTFNLPDCRGRVILGADNMGGSFIGRVSGAVVTNSEGFEAHTLTVGEMATHSHGGTTQAMNRNQDHAHGVPVYNAGPLVDPQFFIVANPSTPNWATDNTPTPHTHSLSAAGSGSSHPNTQPWQAINIMIKT